MNARNRALLERRFGRALPSGEVVVSLKLSALESLLDSARAEERASTPRLSTIEGIFDVFFNGRPAA